MTRWKKVPDAGKDWGQKEKRASEDEKAGWHHQCNECELGRTSGEGQGDLPCCSPWGHKESNTTGCLSNNIAVRDLSTLLSVCVLSCSIMLDSLCPHGLSPARFLSPWDFPGKTGSGLPFPFTGYLLDLGIKPTSPESPAGWFLPRSHLGSTPHHLSVNTERYLATKWQK